MMKPSKQHHEAAQRIYDRLGRGSVADIDAIAQALAEAERGGERKGIREGKRQAAETAYDAAYSAIKGAVYCHGEMADWEVVDAAQNVVADILATIPDEAE